MKIGIDIDEVLAEFLPRLIKYRNQKYNTNFSIDDFDSYNFWETWGGTKEEALNEVMEFFASQDSDDLALVMGAKETIEKLKENHELHIVTSRPSKVIPKTLNWVEKYFNGCFDGVHFADYWENKNLTKAQICLRENIELLVEDSLNYARECADAGCRVLLYDYQWNQADELHENIRRIKSWEEVEREINRNNE